MISKEDIDQWKSSQVTKAFLGAVKERIQEIKDELAITDELDRIKFRQGYIQAMVDLSDISMLEGDPDE